MSKPPNTQTKEFLVRIPKTENKRLSILKFNESLNVKPQQWTAETVRMEREDNRRHGLDIAGDIEQEFGEGSIYGKAARDEARRKKYGRQSKKYDHDNQPWKLTIEQTIPAESEKTQQQQNKEEEIGAGTKKKVRKFRSMREAGAGEHADYWVFYKSGNDLEAYKVDEWYQFLPAVTYKYLDAEQAEERYKERDKVFNQFALKAQIQKQLADQEERQQQETLRTGRSSLKIKDEVSTDEDDEGADEGEGATKAEKKGPKKTKAKKKTEHPKREKKKQRVKNADEIAAYESDDGDDEGREYDYMSDSGSDSGREELNVEQKMEEDLVGVADEKGLKNSLESDEDAEEDETSAEEEEEEPNQREKMEEDLDEEDEEKRNAEKDIRSSSKAVKNVVKMMEKKPGKVEFDENESSASDSDDDPDSNKVKSVLFIQDKRKKQVSLATGTSIQQKKRPAAEESGTSLKSETGETEAKRPKLDETKSEMISEEFIRKLLEKRPHSTKQLLTKVSQRLYGEEVKDKKYVSQLADILKKIEPYQFRKKNETGKEVLFFSMKRTA